MKDKEFMKSLSWSMLVHGTLLFLLFTGSIQLPKSGMEGAMEQQQQANNDKNGVNNQVEVEIIDPPKKKEEIPAPPSEEDGLLAKAPHSKDDCDNFFGGIGVTQSISRLPSGELFVFVTEVHLGYPAQRAGIQRGDELVNSAEIRGEIGTTVEVKVLRRTQYETIPLTFTIVRDKICTTPPKTKGAKQ